MTTAVTSIIVLSAAMYSFSGFIVLQRLGIRLLFQQACELFDSSPPGSLLLLFKGFSFLNHM